MKRKILIFILLIGSSSSLFSQKNSFNQLYEEILISVENPIDIERIDELVSIDIDRLKVEKANFNKNAYIIYVNDKEIPSQLYNDGTNWSIIFVSNFMPNESKEFSIKFLESGQLRRDYKSRTYAELAMKFNSDYINKKFTNEPFQNFTKVVVPQIHTDHDALFKYEGPGWESEKVGYRYYIDWRNATDIFGKKVSDLVLHKVGTEDRVAKDDSYHKMQEWGMDIFKVGNTLGIGSIGMMNADSIYMVSKTDQIICEISFNGPILSEVNTNYMGWKVEDYKGDLNSKLSIIAGSRITNANLTISNDAKNITTGLAKHANTDMIGSLSKADWQYIAIYGKQTLNDDDLGIVLFFKKSDLIEQGEDKLNYYVKLKPNDNNINYKFAAAWEKEFDGIKTKEDFILYINEEILKLNNPLIIRTK